MAIYMKVKVLVAQSCPILCDPMDYSPPGSSVHGVFSGKNTELNYRLLLHVIFRTQGSNLPLCLSCIGGQILYP